MLYTELNSPIKQVDEAIVQFRDGSRFWIQRVAVPVIAVIGMFGNTITIIIMTRKGMRSTINMYLAALAFCDMLYLVLTFLLGLEHYPNMASPEYYLYWKLKPYLMMSTDACSNTSVWLTVTFTIERYIAVKYPIKAKVWCTESRAKLLIIFNFIFGILFVTPVPFEWEVVKRPVIIGNFDQSNKSLNNAYPTTQSSGFKDNDNKIIDNINKDINLEPPFVWALDYSDFGKNDTYKTIYYILTAAIFYIIPLLSLIFFNTGLIYSLHQSSRERSEMTGRGGGIARKTTDSFSNSNNTISTPKVVVDISITTLKIYNNNNNNNEACEEEQEGSIEDVHNQSNYNRNKTSAQLTKSKVNIDNHNNIQSEPLVKETMSNSDETVGETSESNVQINCDNEIFSERSSNGVGSNKNAELISLEDNKSKLHSNNNNYNSYGNIKNLSNRLIQTKRFLRNKSINNQQHQHSVPHTTQERRITIMLISVVILFLCCQSPSAIMILYNAMRKLEENSNELALVLAFNNIINFLMAVNAAGNFILYSLLSKKYRRTFVILFCNCFRVKNKGNNKSQDSNAKTVVRFEATCQSIRNKAAYQINKSPDTIRSDTLV